MRGDRRYPEVDQAGEVETESLHLLDVPSLGYWIAVVLRGEDMRLVGQREDRPYLYLSRIYRTLSTEARGSFRDALCTLLVELTQEGGALSAEPPPEELLLLITKVFSATEEQLRGEVVSLLRELASRFPARGSAGIQHRCLQALVSLRHVAPPSFWDRQLEALGEDGLGVVFSGLSLVSMEAAFRVLEDNAEDSDVGRIVFARLPGVLRRSGVDREKLAILLEGFCACLSPESQGDLRDWAKVLGVALRASPFTLWASADLLSLANLLGLTGVEEGTSRKDLLLAFHGSLLSHLPAEMVSLDAGEPALALLTACKLVLEIGDAIPRRLLERLRASAESLLNELELRSGFRTELLVCLFELEDIDLVLHLKEHAEIA